MKAINNAMNEPVGDCRRVSAISRHFEQKNNIYCQLLSYGAKMRFVFFTKGYVNFAINFVELLKLKGLSSDTNI